MNDIWILPSGEWVVYSDEADIIKDFTSLADLEMVTTYHGIFKKHQAAQFKFIDNSELLKYVCYKAGFAYQQVMTMKKAPGTRYSHQFNLHTEQPCLLVEVEPVRKKNRKKRR